MKKILLAAMICGTMILGINNTTQAAEVSLDNQIEIQELSHWTQFRDGFYKNVLGINRDKDSDERSHFNDRHHSHRHHPPKPHRH